MRLIDADRLLELYDFSTLTYKSDLVIPLEIVIQNIKDAPTVEIKNEDNIAGWYWEHLKNNK